MKVIVACSGGPDSMALLDQCRKKGYDLAVAHVNYKKRDTADRDEKIVQDYCNQYKILMYVDYPEWNHVGNFQAWARDVRYDFFERCASDFDAKQIEVAHQMDDVLETYIFQMQSHRIPACYGIAEKSNRHGYWIDRPLLAYTKADLQKYCEKNCIPFGIDESNLEDDYTRNKIRHHTLNTYTREEKEALFQKIIEKNQYLEQKRKEANQFLEGDWTVLDLLKEKEPSFVFDVYLSKHTHQHYGKKHLESLLEQIQKDCHIDLGEYELESFHNQLYCLKKEKRKNMVLNSIEFKDYGLFSFQKTGKTIEGMTLSAKDFPLTIRTAKPGDKIHLRFGTKKVSRFFVDRKIPKIYRERWLLVENSLGNVIFVPGIGCDVEHFSSKPTAFMVQ